MLSNWPGGIQFAQRYMENVPLFSVANSKQVFQALLITNGGVRDDVGSEKHDKNLWIFIWRKADFKYFISIYCMLSALKARGKNFLAYS